LLNFYLRLWLAIARDVPETRFLFPAATRFILMFCFVCAVVQNALKHFKLKQS